MPVLTPSWSDGTPESWEIYPNIPEGMDFNSQNGELSGTPINVQDSVNYLIWANNTGGYTVTQISISITSLPPDEIFWLESEYIFSSNKTITIPVTNNGPEIESWEVSPPLPSGLQLLDNGTIYGIPDSRTEPKEYTIWALSLIHI